MDLKQKYERFELLKKEIGDNFIKSVVVNISDFKLHFDLLEDVILKYNKSYFEFSKQYLLNIVENGIQILTKKYDLDYMYLLDDICNTYKIKNERYNDSFSKTVKKYGLNTILIRLLDKIGRYDTLSQNPQLDDQGDESIIDTLKDLIAYSIMSIIELENYE